MESTYFSSQFSNQLANKILIENIDEGSNVVLSPISFQLMLSLIAAGSKGRTLDQFLLLLGFKNIDHLNELSNQVVNLTLKYSSDDDNNVNSGPVVSFANGLWVDQQFVLKPSFGKIAKDTYKSEAKEVDFAKKADQVKEEVNLWVENATRGLIKDLLKTRSLDCETALILANALYFKGQWDRRLDKTLTMERDFHLINGQVVRVPFMTSNRYEKYLYNSFDGYKVLTIPYRHGHDTRRFSMYFFLPDEINGLQNLLQKIDSNSSFLNQTFQLWEEDFPDFWIPRFKFSFDFEASTTIKQMGMDLPFMGIGEFTEMVDSSDSQKLHLSKVFHRSYIEVNEDGTEAAASTASQMRWLCGRSPTPKFVADHPFMFMIREEVLGVVLFTGVVMNPSIE